MTDKNLFRFLARPRNVRRPIAPIVCNLCHGVKGDMGHRIAAQAEISFALKHYADSMCLQLTTTG